MFRGFANKYRDEDFWVWMQGLVDVVVDWGGLWMKESCARRAAVAMKLRRYPTHRDEAAMNGAPRVEAT